MRDHISFIRGPTHGVHLDTCLPMEGRQKGFLVPKNSALSYNSFDFFEIHSNQSKDLLNVKLKLMPDHQGMQGV